MSAIDAIGRGLLEGFFMFWETLWALVLGFGLSGAVQAFVTRGEMQRVLGDHSPRVVARAGLLGMASSSCSYAASALAKSLFARGADFTASMVFMFASTNLVVELGIVLWLLIGWQFAVAEFVGGAVMIVLLTFAVPRLVPERWIDDARARLAGDHDTQQAAAATRVPWRQRITSRAGWSEAAGYTIGDLTMLRRELVLGFTIAGLAATLVPVAFWRALFLTGHGLLSTVENVVLGPVLAFVSFVCSIGNVPLAAALWQGHISFGGVVAFVFADLLTLPLFLIYRKYFGGRLALRLLLVFWAVMSTAGLVTEGLFALLHIEPPTRRGTAIATTGFHWNATTVLDIVALVVLAVVYWLYRTRPADESTLARDPVCGMQVDPQHAVTGTDRDGGPVWFCSEHCRQRWAAQAVSGPPHG